MVVGVVRIPSPERLPIQVDNNPAHFPGLIYMIGDWSKRTGHYLPLLTDGVVAKGSKIIVDSVSAVPAQVQLGVVSWIGSSARTLEVAGGARGSKCYMLERSWKVRCHS